MPIAFAGQAQSVNVVLRELQGLSDKTRIEALHPGVEKPVEVTARHRQGTVVLTVPLHRGCAMVRIVTAPWRSRDELGTIDSPLKRRADGLIVVSRLAPKHQPNYRRLPAQGSRRRLWTPRMKNRQAAWRGTSADSQIVRRYGLRRKCLDFLTLSV